MSESWRRELRNLILAYDEDGDLDAGLREAARVVAGSKRRYEHYANAVKAGIESASLGESDVIDALRPDWKFKVPTEAKAFLEEVLVKFQAIYAKTVQKYENKQRMKREEE